jgi:hypothetical protein
MGRTAIAQAALSGNADLLEIMLQSESTESGAAISMLTPMTGTGTGIKEAEVEAGQRRRASTRLEKAMEEDATLRYSHITTKVTVTVAIITKLTKKVYDLI